MPTASAARPSRATSSRPTASTPWAGTWRTPIRCRRATSATAARTSRARPRSTTARSCTRARWTTSSATRCRSPASTSTTSPNEPCANYWEPGLNGPHALRRPGRLHPRAPRQRAGAQQHVAAQQQHGPDTPLRPDEVHRRQHAVDRLRPVDPRVQQQLPRPDDGGQVPAGASERSTAIRGPSTRFRATGIRGAPTAPTRAWPASTR